MKKVFLYLFVVVPLGFSLQANAELIVRGTDSLGYQLIYDTDLDITWYDFTRGPDWKDYQGDWASALDIDFGGTSYTDWRLPACLDEDGKTLSNSSTCTNSEFTHLYYSELDNTASGLTNTGPFQNLQALGYWTATNNYSVSFGWAWAFTFNGGYHGYGPYEMDEYGIAVRNGDVMSTTVVPEPISSTLFIIGAGTLGLWQWRRK